MPFRNLWLVAGMMILAGSAPPTIALGQKASVQEDASLRLPPGRSSFDSPKLPSSPPPNLVRENVQPTPTIAQSTAGDQPSAFPGKPVVSGKQPVNQGTGPLLRSSGSLKDVWFVDQQVGIAVGDGGLIWRSSDGGESWNPCQSPTSDDLSGVVFQDKKNGWAVGGATLPIHGVHRGVVLTTNDGGLSWKKLDTALLPRLIDVWLGQDHRLFAASWETAQFPSRVFESQDGGYSWTDLSFTVPPGERSEIRDLPTKAPGAAWTSDGRGVVTTWQGTVSVKDGQGVWAKFQGERATQGLRLESVGKVGDRLFGIDQRGQAWMSIDLGDRWLPLSAILPAHISSGLVPFQDVACTQDDCWLISKETGRILSYRPGNQNWNWLSLPEGVAINHFFRSDSENAWAVGPLGNVCRTQDGGRSWTWQHSLHQNLAILVVAARLCDVPPALLTQLSVNNGLNVGLLIGDSKVPEHAFQSIASQNQLVWASIQPAAFQHDDASRRASAMERTLETLRPQILLACPGNSRTQVPVTDWISAAQRLRNTSRKPAEDPWGVLGQTVQLTSHQAEASTSLRSYLPALQQELGDAAYVSHLLSLTWTPDYQANDDPLLGIRTIATAGIGELNWFGGVVSLDNPGLVKHLSRRPVVRPSDSVFNLAQQISTKASWIAGFSAATTNTPDLRGRWLTNLKASLVQVPQDCQQRWLVQLGHRCLAEGAPRKACLAWIEAWNIDTQNEVGLYALLQALPLLTSDEVQWETRRESQQLARQEMLAAEERLQAAIERGQTSEEFQLDEALRRWGIDPRQKDQVPPGILDRIQALERARNQEGSIAEAPETMLKIPDFQSHAQVGTPTVRQFDDPKGNQVTRNTRVVSWIAGGTTNSQSGAGIGEPGHGKTVATIIDQLPAERLKFAYHQSRLAEGLWPHLLANTSWWQHKARMAGESGEVTQCEAAWNRVERYLANQPTDQQSRDILTFERQASLMLATITSPNVLTSVWADQRPVLDGRLDDPMWQQQAFDNLQASGEGSLRVWLANDEQFLYVAIRVAQPAKDAVAIFKPGGIEGSPRRIHRPRDEVDPSDAIKLKIDTDRDYQTDFTILIDREGGIAEMQQTNVEWNPLLFVSQDKNQQTWTIEFALDLKDVSIPMLGKYWYFQVDDSGNSGASMHGWARLKDPMQLIP